MSGPPSWEHEIEPLRLPLCTYCRQNAMLIKSSYKDVETKANGRAGKMRIFVIEPNVPDYPDAKFPGCKLGPLAAGTVVWK